MKKQQRKLQFFSCFSFTVCNVRHALSPPHHLPLTTPPLLINPTTSICSSQNSMCPLLFSIPLGLHKDTLGSVLVTLCLEFFNRGKCGGKSALSDYLSLDTKPICPIEKTQKGNLILFYIYFQRVEQWDWFGCVAASFPSWFFLGSFNKRSRGVEFGSLPVEEADEGFHIKFEEKVPIQKLFCVWSLSLYGYCLLHLYSSSVFTRWAKKWENIMKWFSEFFSVVVMP